MQKHNAETKRKNKTQEQNTKAKHKNKTQKQNTKTEQKDGNTKTAALKQEPPDGKTVHSWYEIGLWHECAKEKKDTKDIRKRNSKR